MKSVVTGFISVAECEVLHNNALINLHMTHTAAEMGVPRCGAEEQGSKGAEVNLLRTPAPMLPCSEGWEKLYAERVAMAYGRRPPIPPNIGGLRGAVRIARFENCYGPEGTHSLLLRLRSGQALVGGRRNNRRSHCT